MVESGVFMVTKQDIRSKAFHIIAYKGFSETTTDNIASSLGLKKQSLYSHYKNKNEIIADVLREQTEIVIKSLEKTVDDLRDSSVETLLRGIFESIVTVFSVHERLLLWKRINIIKHSSEYKELRTETDWLYIRKLHNDLYAIISVKHPEFKALTRFKVFFFTYLMMIQGYLEWMLLSRNDDKYFTALWQDYWNGVKYKFVA